MTDRVHPAVRAPIGFVVEGHGEHATFPGIVTRILRLERCHVPRALGRGFGGITSNLHEHLDDLVQAYHPLSVVVTVDRDDAMGAFGVESCEEARAAIEEMITGWVESRSLIPRMEPLPLSIVAVLQVPVFESWWLADCAGLASTGLFTFEEAADWTDVDSEVTRPETFLLKRRTVSTNIKSAAVAKTVVASLDLDTVHARSRSFRKFVKEIRIAYDRWQEAVAAA